MKLGDKIHHFRRTVEWEIIYINKTQYETKVKLKCLSSNKTVNKSEFDLDDYKYVGGSWVNPRAEKSKRYYTDEQKQFIIDNYGLLNVVELAHKINRSPSSVSNMAFKLREEGYDLPTPKHAKGVRL